MPTYGRPLSTAAAAAAAIKRTPSTGWMPRRTSGSTPTPTPSSRQGSIDMDRDEIPVQVEEDEEPAPVDPNVPLSQPTQDVENEDDDENKEELVLDMDAHMQAQMEKAKEDMKVLLENFTGDQLHRYEGYRRSALNRTNVKRLVSQVLNQQCSQTMAFVVAGFSKVYVGEIIEKAREVMEEWGHSGAIRPEHLREAHRRYKKERVKSASIGKKLIQR
ncbi:hTAFII28-like protein conserved region-domain-containing protein [Phycomyces nitens]|nr:hTAFII28-like protein conserved region-domain-containing protein [Phycomyces nitens]